MLERRASGAGGAGARGRSRRCRGQRAEHGGGLAGGLAAAGGLDRRAPPRGRGPSRPSSRSGCCVSLAVARSTTAASAAEISGRARWTSGSGSRTCFIATATWRVGLERDLAGEHLVEDDPERVDVGLRGDLVAERLLGRDVVGRAEHAAGGGQALRLERAGDAEVGDLGAALVVDQDVLRLDVAVDEAVLVRALERPADLDRVGDGLGHRQRARGGGCGP